MKPREWVVFFALGLIWGSSFLWIKIAVQEVDPFTLVSWRLLFGTLGMVAVIVLRAAFVSARLAKLGGAGDARDHQHGTAVRVDLLGREEHQLGRGRGAEQHRTVVHAGHRAPVSAR